MSVYVDNVRDWGWRLGPSCHLAADTLAELHAFAGRIGLKRSWFQDDGRPHYDLTEARRREAVRLGARQVERRELLLAARRCR